MGGQCLLSGYAKGKDSGKGESSGKAKGKDSGKGYGKDSGKGYGKDSGKGYGKLVQAGKAGLGRKGPEIYAQALATIPPEMSFETQGGPHHAQLVPRGPPDTPDLTQIFGPQTQHSQFSIIRYLQHETKGTNPMNLIDITLKVCSK